MTEAPMTQHRLIQVGRVAGGFGVRGEVRITAFSEDPLALKSYKALLREDGTAGLTIQSARAAKGGIIARVAELETKEQADAMRGLRLYVPREALPAPGEDRSHHAGPPPDPDSSPATAAAQAFVPWQESMARA